MIRFQFSLKQLLIGVVVVAMQLLVIQFAIRTAGAALGLLVVLLGVAILAVSHVLLYFFLRSLGAVFGGDAAAAHDESPVHAAENTPGGSPSS